MATSAENPLPPPQKEEALFAPLRLGPVARTETYTSLSQSLNFETSNTQLSTSASKYPRIVVKDHLGRTLDTFTTLQDAIYRANWARKQLGEWPKTPFEWRLPKAPVPSRPDYSRAGPKWAGLLNNEQDHVVNQGFQRQSNGFKSSVKRIDTTSKVGVHMPTVEIAVDDIAFVAESLNHLPNLPSFSFLRQSILTGQSTYIQIVASIILHQKELRATDIREAGWEFPGFCSGCKRAGFCYGCSKNPKPHVHEDVPAMIGGGFRFWKRDRPRDPHNWKHPGQWGLPTTEEELKKVIEQYGGLAAYEQAVLRARREMARRSDEATDESTPMDTGQVLKLQRLKNLGTYPPYVTIVSTEDFDKQRYYTTVQGNESETSKIVISRRPGDQAEPRKTSTRESTSRAVSAESQSSAASLDRTLIRVDTAFFQEALEDDMQAASLDNKDIHPRDLEDNQRDHDQARTRTTSSIAQTDINDSSRKRPTRKISTLTRSTERVHTGSEDGSGEETPRLGHENSNDSAPSDRKRRETGYKAPKFFKVQKQSRKITAKDPFSSDRDLNVPKGPAFQLKKSDKKLTEFVDFKRSDGGWTAPKKFEIKHKTRTKGKHFNETDLDENGTNGYAEKSRRDSNKAQSGESPDSGLDNSLTDASLALVDQDRKDNDGADDLIDDIDTHKDDDIDDNEDESNEENSGRHKRQSVVRKSKVEFSTPPDSPPHLPSPPPPPSHEVVTPPVSPPPESLSSVLEDPPLPELDIPEVPRLPDIVEKTHEQGKKREKLKFMVDPPPQLQQVKEEPKKRRAAPKIRTIPRKMFRQRKTRPAEAAVTTEELKDIHDPLDFLARWCIINPDRLPFYELVFEYTVADQTPLYTKPQSLEQETQDEREEQSNQVDNTEVIAKKGKRKLKKGHSDEDSDKGRQLNARLLPAERGMNFMKTTMTVEEQHLEKLIFTLDLLHDKMLNLGNSLEELEEISAATAGRDLAEPQRKFAKEAQTKRIKMLASKARETFPQIASPSYSPKKKKGKKGKKKDKQPAQTLKSREITDAIIVDRLDGKMLDELCREEDMKLLESEIEILQDKIREVQRRVEEIAREKLLTDAFCMNHYFLRQGIHEQTEDFKRQQSELYNRLHPAPDFEMNLEEVEEALQQINNHLLTKREFNFLYNVLNLPGREKINFRLFSIIAALSEKVTQLDPVIRKMMNNFDYNALDTKMEKCKELFSLLDMDHMPQGAAQAESLAVELTAGGLKPEHTRYVLNKFNRESKGAIDFLDFVTYIPLFVEIHKRIVQDPLKADLDL